MENDAFSQNARFGSFRGGAFWKLFEKKKKNAAK